jgi:hypothetical protein
VARGAGWYGFWLTPEATAGCLAGLRAAADRVERAAELGELEITITPRGRLTRENARRSRSSACTGSCLGNPRPSTRRWPRSPAFELAGRRALREATRRVSSDRGAPAAARPSAGPPPRRSGARASSAPARRRRSARDVGGREPVPASRSR